MVFTFTSLAKPHVAIFVIVEMEGLVSVFQFFLTTWIDSNRHPPPPSPPPPPFPRYWRLCGEPCSQQSQQLQQQKSRSPNVVKVAVHHNRSLTRNRKEISLLTTA